jgi:hypothetical protein
MKNNKIKNLYRLAVVTSVLKKEAGRVIPGLLKNDKMTVTTF